MEKRLVVSMACGEESRDIAKITMPHIQAYALKCGADFHLVSQVDDSYKHLGYQKFNYVNLPYDRILHIDADMLVKESTPNLFDVVGRENFAGVDEHPYEDRLTHLRKYCEDPSFYINVGMYLFNVENHRHIFNREVQELDVMYYEQTHINILLNNSEFQTHLLPWNYNCMFIMEDAGHSKDDAYIIHYAGKYRGLTHEKLLEVIKTDERKYFV